MTTKTRAKIGVSHSHTTMTDLIRIDRFFFSEWTQHTSIPQINCSRSNSSDIEKRSYAVCSSFVF